MIRDLVLSLPQTNYVTLALSIWGLTFLEIGKKYVNPWVNKRSPVPLPLELILVRFNSYQINFYRKSEKIGRLVGKRISPFFCFQVILTTAFSTILSLKNEYNVKIVDTIPQGYLNIIILFNCIVLIILEPIFNFKSNIAGHFFPSFHRDLDSTELR